METRKSYPIARPIVALAVAAPLLLAGCHGYLALPKDNYDMYRAPAAAQSQILNPEAGKNRKVVAGLDGAAAGEVTKSYTKSFEREVPKSASETFVGLSGISSN